MKMHLFRPGQLEQVAVAVLAGFAIMTSGQTFAWPSASLLKLKRGEVDFSLSDTEVTWVTSSVFIGNLVSPFPSGYLMDLMGRRRSLLLCLSFIYLSWAFILGVHSATGLYVARLLAGMWSGVAYTIVPVYCGETLMPSMRGVAGSLISLGLFLGSCFMSTLAPFVSYDMLAILSCIPPTITLALLLIVPESPYYYLKRGDSIQAKSSLTWLRGTYDVQEELNRMGNAVREQEANKGKMTDLFVKPYLRKAVIITSVLGLLQRMSGLTITFSYASMFIPSSFLSVEMSVMVITLFFIPSGLLGIYTMSVFKRKTNFNISSAGTGLALGTAAVWYYLRDAGWDMTSVLWVPFITFLFFALFYSLGIVSILGVYQGELFPVNVKALASSWTALLTALFSIASTAIFLPLTNLFGVYSNFLISALFSLSGVAFSYFYMIETKDKTLEEIQDILEGRTENVESKLTKY